MKLIVLMSALTWVAASQLPPVAIISQFMEINPDGSYRSSYETADGVKVIESGYLKQIDPDNAGTASTGSYEYPAPDGTLIKVNWIADENGFQPSGDHLPVAPPMPEHVVKLLDDLRASGALELNPEHRQDVAPKSAPAPKVPVASVATKTVAPAPVAPVAPKIVAPASVAPVVARVVAPATVAPVAPVPVPASTVPVVPFEAQKVRVSTDSVSPAITTTAARNFHHPRTRVASVPALQTAPLVVPDQVLLPARTLQLPLIPVSGPMPDNVIKFLSSKSNPTYFPGH